MDESKVILCGRLTKDAETRPLVYMESHRIQSSSGNRIAGLYIILSLFAYIMCSTLNILAQCQVIFQSGCVNLIPTYNLLTLLFLPIQVGGDGQGSVVEHLSTTSKALSCFQAPTRVGCGGWYRKRNAFEDVQKWKSSYIFQVRKSKRCSYFPLRRKTAP